jgi:adenylate cyclase
VSSDAPTVLVVDDTPQNVRLLEAVLTSQGYSVISASSGPEALEKVAAAAPDLVLLDIQMPGMNGYEVCRRIREDPTTRFLPVVLVTASDTEVRVNAIEAEADDFITKPFDQQELLGRVRSLVRIKRYHDTIEEQSAELAEWNRNLKARVQGQVEELENLNRLRRFLPLTLAQSLQSQGEEILESHRREIAALFADLRGWTAFSVTTEPEEVMGVIGEFHTTMGELITRFEATVGWFAGDGLMVWFNDPIPCLDPAARAVRLAVAMRGVMAELTSKWRKRGHELDFSVGIALGYATLGRIGFEGRYDYGAVGSVMNLASRLCDEAGLGQILVNERVFAEVEDLVDGESAGEFTLKGFVKPVPAFRIVDLKTHPAEAIPAPGPVDDRGRLEKLAGYRIESELGRGGMGVVYLAEDERLHRKVALKVLAPEVAHDDGFRARFARESELAAGLEHPNVVPIYQAGEADGRLFIAMRFIRGANLAQLLEVEGRLEPARTLAILTQVASGLDEAHANGLVHRDVKPANILIAAGRDGGPEHAYLSDFGLTKRSDSATGPTRTGQVLGTLAYAAPEQIEGAIVDAAADVYSVGCVVFHSLTGQVPFRKDSDVAMMWAHVREAPPKATALRAELPARVDAVIAKAMSKDPAERYPSCGDLAADLAIALGA